MIRPTSAFLATVLVFSVLPGLVSALQAAAPPAASSAEILWQFDTGG